MHHSLSLKLTCLYKTHHSSKLPNNKSSNHKEKMGFLQGPLCCHSQDQQQQQQQSQSHHDHHLHSESSTSSSLSSQPSLPSVPSLTLQPPHQPQTTHHHLLATVKGHSSPISALALHGKSLYAASSAGEITTCPRDPSVLKTSSTTITTNTNVVAISNAPIKSLIISDGTLFTAHQDHKIRVWKIQQPIKTDTSLSDCDDLKFKKSPLANMSTCNLEQNCLRTRVHVVNQKNKTPTYKCIATLPTLNDRFSKLFSSKNYVEIRRHKKCTWVHHVDTVSVLALSRDKSLLYSASWDRTFKIWRTSDFKCLESVKKAHDDAINTMVVSNDGVVYTGSADKKIKMWKKRDGEKKHSLLGTLEKHKSAVNALALSEDGSVLYSGACDRSILVWEGQNGNNENNNDMVVVGALRGHTKAILCLVVVEDLVCSGSADNSVRVWRRGVEKGYSCLTVLEGHRRPVKCLAMAVDNSNGDEDNSRSYLVYSGGLDCDIKVWQIRVPLM